MARTIINHLNYISQNINDSIQENAPYQDREIFCKRFHEIMEPTDTDCEGCPYFAGLMHGYGHECTWEDIVPADIVEWSVNPRDKQKELLRVSALIDKGYIKKY